MARDVTDDKPPGWGIRPLYAGRGMSVWETLEEAERSWDHVGVYDGITYEPFRFWRDNEQTPNSSV